jgi:type IV pilus assembly protein PilY1
LSGVDPFLLDLDAAAELLKDTAHRGGGEFFKASDEASLIDIFNKIIAGALGINTSFSSPAVSVNAFNRSTHLDDLYFTLFEPAMTNHWNGNLKKYKLKFAVDTTDKDGDGDTTEKLPFIADKLGNSAVDPATGFFDVDATSFWSTAVDGKEVTLGGAVGVLTTPRNVYTFTGTYAANTTGVNQPSDGVLDIPSNAVHPTNASLTDALLGTTGFSDIVTGATYRETLINWASGLDALGEFGSVATDVRPQMGDPLHAEPALVQYGEVAGVPDLVAYVATNDGYLHAFDVDSGKELFAFIPQELLTNLPEIMENNRADKTYGLDGSVIAWVNDANKDGAISGAGEHVYLYFGMRRGGNNIYSLDVTDRTKPKFRWVIKGGTGDYTELGQTWSTINVEKVKDGAAEKTVLIFGGGYDTAQDGKTLRTPDSVARTVYIADADTGLRMWSAGKDGASPITDMEYSIPARIKPLDISGDGFIDRLYAADTGGQIFRFDINNTNASPLAGSITGGRIVDIAGADAEDNRRFYYPPDVALVNAPDGKYHGLVISSGYRAHPLNDVIHDRIYLIKDRDTGLTKDYTAPSLTEADLHNVTANLAGGDSGAKGDATADAARDVELANIANAEGWYIDLEDEDNPGSWIGEKGLAEPLILEGVAIVSTYTPNVKAGNDVCGPNEGLGKVFFLDILDATPAFPSNVDVRSDRNITLVRGGIPPTPGGILPKGGEATICVGTECQPADLGLGVRKTYWYEVEK